MTRTRFRKKKISEAIATVMTRESRDYFNVFGRAALREQAYNGQSDCFRDVGGHSRATSSIISNNAALK